MEQIFTYCPHCGSKDIEFPNLVRFLCHQCGFVYYHNIAAAVAVIFRREREILFVVRNIDPDKGKLDLPGGFIDPDENAEAAACREMNEELGLEITPNLLKYVTTQPNHYLYKDVPYRTMDIFYECPLDVPVSVRAADEIKSLQWIPIPEIDLSKIGFVSVRTVIEKYYLNQ